MQPDGDNGQRPGQAPMVSILMPCYNEAGYIRQCLAGVFAQTYPADRLEILVADGNSTDGTRAILDELAAHEPRLRVIDNPERLQAPGMNLMIKAARGEILVRMDVHCEYAPNYVQACVDVLSRTGADNAGGAQRARARTLFQRALCAALDSPLGVGGASYRSADNEGFVDTVFLGAFRREVFERVGLYDPRAITNEDAELNQRLIAAGGKVYLSRDIEVYYYPRDSFRALARQYYKYGRGRARTLLKLGKFLALRPALPFLMVSAGVLLIVTSPVQPLTPVYFGAYAALTLAEAVRMVARRRRKSSGGEGLPWSAVPLVWACFPVLHVSHGVGFAAGLAWYLRAPDWEAPERLTPVTSS